MHRFDPLIHQPVRLRITAALASTERDAKVDFAFLRDCLKLTDGNLGAHLSKLENAGYVRLEKTFVDGKPRTFAHLTSRGRDAFEQHVAALRSILAGD